MEGVRRTVAEHLTRNLQAIVQHFFDERTANIHLMYLPIFQEGVHRLLAHRLTGNPEGEPQTFVMLVRSLNAFQGNAFLMYVTL